MLSEAHETMKTTSSFVYLPQYNQAPRHYQRDQGELEGRKRKKGKWQPALPINTSHTRELTNPLKFGQRNNTTCTHSSSISSGEKNPIGLAGPTASSNPLATITQVVITKHSTSHFLGAGCICPPGQQGHICQLPQLIQHLYAFCWMPQLEDARLYITVRYDNSTLCTPCQYMKVFTL